MKTYQVTLRQFKNRFQNREIDSITSEEILSFLTELTEGTKQSTKNTRYSQIKCFYNFIRQNLDTTLQNPCDAPMLRKLFRPGKPIHSDILDKEIIDEIIFRTIQTRNRLMLELMAKGGMRIGEILNLVASDVGNQKVTIRDPKSGKDHETVFIPKRLAERIHSFIDHTGIEPSQRIFPLSYAGARVIVRKAGALVGVHLRPHDLRRHAATYASRSGIPIEIISKVILRHSNLSTTQRYLGKISDEEATHWIEQLYR